MASNSRLYRNFIILQEDERGYASANDKSLSGYAKIEAKGDICKISFYAQNLRKDEDKYNMMLICDKKDNKQIVDLGKLDVSIAGKADYTKEYNVDNIAGIELSLDKISGAAIGKYKDGVPIFIMCGFLNGQQPCEDWKNYKVIKAKGDKELQKKMHYKEEKKHDKKDKKDKCDDREEIKEVVNEEIKVEEVSPKIEEEKRVESIEEKDIKEESVEENSKEPIEEVKEDRKDQAEEVKLQATIEENMEIQYPKENLRGKFEDYEEFIEENKEFNPRTNKIRGTIGEYFEAIAEGFEEDEGYDELKYCKWYKVPVHDLYEMCNMSNYNKYTLVYYPMLNYYPYIKKYNYFKLGYKCDFNGNLKYIIYAIPGKKDKDEQPYDGRTGFVTWVAKDPDTDIGCWLMFYDFKNSTVVVPMQ